MTSTRRSSRSASSASGAGRGGGGPGAQRIGDDASAKGSPTPTLYSGKGFGDLPDSLRWLKPLAVTGTFGYQFQDVPTSTSLGTDSNGNPLLVRSSNPDLIVWGASIQYSI